MSEVDGGERRREGQAMDDVMKCIPYMGIHYEIQKHMIGHWIYSENVTILFALFLPFRGEIKEELGKGSARDECIRGI